MKKIHSYTTIKFTKIFFGVLVSIVLLTVIIDFVELTRRLSGKSATLMQTINLTILKQPSLMLDVMPFVILLSGILFLVKLSDNSEITILKASGISLKKIFKAPLIIITAIALIEILLFNHFATYTERIYKKNINNILSPGHIIENHIDQGMWFKQNKIDIPYIFKSQRIVFKENLVELYDIKLIFIGDNNDNLLYANKATIKERQLNLHDITMIGKHNEEIYHKDSLTLATSLSKEFMKNKIRNIESDFGIASIWDILSSLQMLKTMGFNVSKQTSLLNFYMAKPILYISLFLLSGIFCIYPPRHQKKILYIIISVISGFFIYFILNISYTLTSASELSILFGIWLPHILLLLSILYLLIRKERRYFT